MAHPPTTPTIEPLFVSRADAATALAISLRSISYLIAEERIKVRKLGGRTLISVQELRRFAEADQTDSLVPVAA